MVSFSSSSFRRYKTYIVSELPKVSYSTWLDRYMIACILGLAAMGMESAAMFWLARVKGDGLLVVPLCNWTVPERWFGMLGKFEERAGLMCMLVWCLVHLVFLKDVWRKAKSQTQLEKEKRA